MSTPFAGLFQGAANAMLAARGKLLLAVLVLFSVSLSVSVVPDPGVPAWAAAPPVPPREPDKPPAPPRTDQFGDPLPPGALARMGTTRFRHGGYISRITYTPDGETLFSLGDDGICAWEAATGKEVRHVQGYKAWAFPQALAPDGKAVAFDREGKLRLLDLATRNTVHAWEISSTHQAPANKRWLWALAFAPDGRRLAMVTDEGVLWLADPDTGRTLRQLTEPKSCSGPFAFSPDGRLVAYHHSDHTIRLCRTASGEEIRRFRLAVPGTGNLHDQPPAPEFSPDGKLLAALFFEAGRPYGERTLCLCEVASGKEVRRWTGREDGIAQFAFCGDGRTLALGGVDGTIRLWDLAAAKETRRFAAHPAGVSALAASPDGRTLASGGGDLLVRQWDLATGKELSPAGGHQGGVLAVAFPGDGRTLATAAADDTLRFWDTFTGRELRRCEACEFVGERGTVLLPTPDGRGVMGSCKGATVRFWDAATGREERRLQLTPGWRATALTLTPDGKTLAVAESNQSAEIARLASRVSLWDLTADKPRRVHPDRSCKSVMSLAFSPDGDSVLGLCILPSVINSVRLYDWDLVNGGERRSLDVVNLGFNSAAFAFSADGRWLAVQNWVDIFPADRDFMFSLWDVAAGREVRQFKGAARQVGKLAFSPDGRTLACASEDGVTVRCWEVATGEERRRFVGHRGEPRALAFSADGTLLASGTTDTTAVVWDVAGRLTPRQGPPTAREVEAWWADLLGDTVRADRAIWALTTAPEQVLPLLRKGLKPVAPPDANRLARLLADLDSKNFAVRKQAAAELEQLAELVEPALRRALAEKPTLEVARQLEGLLERATNVARSPRGEALRGVRALEVLEHIASPEARTLVEALAAGMTEANLTREAKATLQRLARRSAPQAGVRE
jgi:WD40 repeat protein